VFDHTADLNPRVSVVVKFFVESFRLARNSAACEGRKKQGRVRGRLRKIVDGAEQYEVSLRAELFVLFGADLIYGTGSVLLFHLWVLGIKEVKSNGRTRDNRLWRRFSQVEQLPQSQRKQIVQILDAFLEREKLKKAS
jgi:hypothetical protein